MHAIPALFAQLPLAQELAPIEARIAQGGNLLLTAPTGTGKSSLLPWLLSQNQARVAVLQPRRLAASSLSRFLARAFDEEPGATVGYRFRLESRISAQTRIVFQTYGSFVQAQLGGNEPRWDWVVFDEFHERRSEMDLLLAYLLAWQKKSPQEAPRIAVLSAELNRETLENLLGISCLRVGNPGYTVQIVHQEPKVSEPLEKQVVRAVRSLRANQVWNTTLVFLPGKAEIERCHREVEDALGPGAAELLDLHGNQENSEQKRIFENTDKPRVVFTTNIAETSLTIPQVSAVVDSGLERTADYDVGRDLRVLRLGRISLQNAVQRTGRAGRTRAGVCIRLWGERDEASFPKEVVPEVLRSKPDLLLLHRAALAHRANLEPSSIRLPNTPPPLPEKNALALLARLNLLDESGQITQAGLGALDVPLQSVELAAMLYGTQNPCDLLLACAVWLDGSAENAGAARESRNLLQLAQDLLENSRAVPRDLPKLFQRLTEWKSRRRKGMPQTEAETAEANATRQTLEVLYKTFPSFLAIADGAGNSYKLADQFSLALTPEQTGNAPGILAFSLLRTGSQKNQQVKTSLFVPLPASMLHSEESTIHYELVWRAGQERYTGLRIRRVGEREMERKELIPQECTPADLAQLVALTVPTWKERMAREDLSHCYRDEATETLLIKMQLAAKWFPEYNFPSWEDDDWELVMDEFLHGVFLLRDLDGSRFRRIVEDYFGKPMLGWLNKTFPDHLKLANGKSARYTYSSDGIIELSARLGDFMGMHGEHRIAENRIQVRYDILAPNYRTVQKTWDLTSFWKNTYAEVRKELRGRYPRHPWPEQAP